MTTASGSTTSSPDTQSTLRPLEEAPFSTYLKILRENGYESDADISEQFYIDLLTGVDLGEDKRLTKEQIYTLPFKDVYKAGEVLLQEMQRQIADVVPPNQLRGPMLAGADADKLKPEEINRLMNRQTAIIEDEKARLSLG